MQVASFATAAGRELDLIRDFPSGMSAPTGTLGEKACLLEERAPRDGTPRQHTDGGHDMHSLVRCYWEAKRAATTGRESDLVNSFASGTLAFKQ